MGFGTNIMKSLMFIFNGIVWVLGLVLFVVGIVVLIEGENWNDIIDNKTVPVSVLLIVVGLVIAIVGFLGCFGAMKQNTSMLLIYAVILGVIILVQLVAGILAFIFSDEAEEVVTNNMEGFIKTYDGNTEKNTVLVLNLIMEEFDCCGVNSAGDFATLTNATIWTQTNVPDSCCKVMTTQCGWDYDDEDDGINHVGCLTKTVAAFRDKLKIAGICALAFVVIQIIGVLIACNLRNVSKGVLA